MALLISAPSSSAGKTTVTCALLWNLKKNKNLNVSSLKVGPDFIDPLFHSETLGIPGGNLDSYFCSEEKLKELFSEHIKNYDFSLVEGAMGLFDGIGGNSSVSSAFEVSEILDLPVILVVDVKGKSFSVCAEINGFIKFRKQSNIRGVILNRCSEQLYKKLSSVIKKECGIETYGFLENNSDFEIKSRHLGLVTPDAVADLNEKIRLLGQRASETLDIQSVLELSKNENHHKLFPVRNIEKKSPAVRIAIARDEAFCFYYQENFALLRNYGAELCFFSPLKNEKIPENCSALYIGGGYPELFSFQLAENSLAKESIKKFVRAGAPVFAECGGFLYLQMIGLLEGSFEKKNHLVRFGYAEFESRENNFLCKKGEKIKGHEFHYFETTENGNSFKAVKASGGKSWECIQVSAPVSASQKKCCAKKILFEKNIIAGFPHLYFPSNEHVAENFVLAAIAFDSYEKSKPSCKKL